MGTARRITLTDITSRPDGGVMSYCFWSDGVPVGFLRWPVSLNLPHRRGTVLSLPDVAGHLNDCVDTVRGDVVAGFHLFVASDMLQPHGFTLSVPDLVHSLQRPHALVANTPGLPLLMHCLGWGSTTQNLTCRCRSCTVAGSAARQQP